MAKIDDKALRPITLSDFVGQEKFKDNLNIYIQSAKSRKEPLDHILLSGSAGFGKTSLSNIIANEMGGDFYPTISHNLTDPLKLLRILEKLKPNSILFIDEIHGLKKEVEEILYSAMEDYKVYFTSISGVMKYQQLNPFTVIGATTKAGSISEPLRARFRIQYTMKNYSMEEMKNICTRSARKLGFLLDDNGAELLSQVCRGTPRIANNYLYRVRDFAKNGVMTIETVEKTMEAMEIDKFGMTPEDRKYLQYLVDNNLPVGVKAIAVYLQTDTKTVEDVIEPYLVSQGLITRTSKGRIISEKCADLINEGELKFEE